ncbi:MAG: RDD family protein [Saprospiraceae bacterium]|nr:RDD family protein [Saprospiraceae bacterium]
MPNIDIRTTQNVTIEYELAPLRERFFAFFIDLMIYLAASYAFWLMVLMVVGDAITGWGGRFIILVVLFAGLVTYHLLSDVLGNGRSLGKRAINLKVVRLDGLEPGIGEYLLRSIFLLVDFNFTLGVLAAILIGSTYKNQRLGDLAANTTVIRVKSQLAFRLHDILKINTLENYEPKYPAVRQMNEADMLLIKNLLGRYQSWQNTAHAEAIREATANICKQLDIEAPKGNQIEFLKTLIRDYIVLTR